MNQCQKESQRHGFCSKHLSQMREPMQRLVDSIGHFPHAAALPFLTEFYQRRFDYSLPIHPPTPSFYPSILPESSLHSFRSYSTPSLLVNSNPSTSAFVPLMPMVRQHSMEISSSNRHHSDDDDDVEIDIESIPSPSKFLPFILHRSILSLHSC